MLLCMTPRPAPRIALIDAARTAALGGMAAFHFTYDLEMFGLISPGTVALPGPWAYFARFVAGSFLFLAGASLLLANENGIRWPTFLRRFATVAAAALAISSVTYVIMPGTFVFFGILHAIATFSVIGLVFLRLPALVILIIAAAVFTLPQLWRNSLFQTPALVWLGLAPVPPRSMDFEPLFPWLAPFLAGMAMIKAAKATTIWPTLSCPPGPLLQSITWPGRHSLAVYLIHQPVLIALVWTITLLLNGAQPHGASQADAGSLGTKSQPSDQ